MKIMAQQFHTLTAKRASESYGGSPHRPLYEPLEGKCVSCGGRPL
jgi:hypothetical protein